MDRNRRPACGAESACSGGKTTASPGNPGPLERWPAGPIVSGFDRPVKRMQSVHNSDIVDIQSYLFTEQGWHGEFLRTRHWLGLRRAAAEIRASAAHFSEVRAKSAVDVADRAQITEVNRRLIAVSRSFLRQGGLPGRPFYENELYSPGRLWDTVPISAIGDAMLDGDWATAAAQLPLVAGTLRSIAHSIEAASEAIERTPSSR